MHNLAKLKNFTLSLLCILVFIISIPVISFQSGHAQQVPSAPSRSEVEVDQRSEFVNPFLPANEFVNPFPSGKTDPIK